MQRHEQIIQLSNHVKDKLKQHQYPSSPSPLINSSDEFIEVNTSDDDDDINNNSKLNILCFLGKNNFFCQLDSLLITSENVNRRRRRNTFVTYKIKQPPESFFTDGKSHPNPNNISILQEKYAKQQQCQECIQHKHIIHYERQRLLRLYDENRNLTEQLRSSVLLNRQYENDIFKLKEHLRIVNSHLYEYHINFDELKQKIESEKKTTPKIDEEVQEEEDKHDTTLEHIKRLRDEVHMYNRLVNAKQQEEQKKVNFLF
ncbi:unnamed protein product [Adineta steineri]|uniref:Uncharacterized protein n=1 Tax=Adineta steineri TaxID=433720 RepID=A0A813WCF7_9BILA|nr:unnamed protein product [Adineta steineri]